MKIVEIEYGKATVEIHGNQQGTFHGGLFCEFVDATTDTAPSTVIGKMNLLKVWNLKSIFSDLYGKIHQKQLPRQFNLVK